MSGQGPFEASEDLSVCRQEDVHIVVVRAGLSSKGELLAELAKALSLPDYFGFNWDALLDCLRDLHWIGHRHVVIIHSDVPELPQHELKQYLGTLADAVQSWQPNQPHRLRVGFPQGARFSTVGDVVS